MAMSSATQSLDFLALDPEPVIKQPAQSSNSSTDQLPISVVNKLMRIPGIDGVWIERNARGQRVVILHYTPGGRTSHLPSTVQGLPTRIVGGEPIRAQ